MVHILGTLAFEPRCRFLYAVKPPTSSYEVSGTLPAWKSTVSGERSYSVSYEFPRSNSYGLKGVSCSSDRGRPWLQGTYHFYHDLNVVSVRNTEIAHANQLLGQYSLANMFAVYDWHERDISHEALMAVLNEQYLDPLLEQDMPYAFDYNADLSDAVRRFKPTSFGAQFGQFLIELRDLPKTPFLHVIRSRTLLARQAGHEYLNVEFGWLPFYQDVRQFCVALLNFNKRLKFLLANNGLPVRRKGTVYSSTSDLEILDDFQVPPAYQLCVDTVGGRPVGSTNYLGAYVEGIGEYDPVNNLKRKYTKSISTFAGQFVFHLDAIQTLRYERQISRIAFGVDLSPEVLWEIFPYSWLVDWFSNIGNLISHWLTDQSDRLVMRYGYIMGEKHYITDYVTDPISLRTHDDRHVLDHECPITASSYEEVVIKTRAPAGPYGLAVKLNELSLKRMAILVALGLVLFG